LPTREDTHARIFRLLGLLRYNMDPIDGSIYLSIGINVRFAAMMADVGDGRLDYLTRPMDGWTDGQTDTKRQTERCRLDLCISGACCLVAYYKRQQAPKILNEYIG